MIKKVLPRFTFLCTFLFSTFSQAQAITSFSLVNAQNGTEIQTLTDGDTVFLPDVSADQFSIRANTSGEFGSMVFSLDDEVVQTENQAPYALLGNSGNTYSPWNPELKTVRISAAVHASSGGNGALLNSSSIDVTFTNEVAMDAEGPQVQSLVLINADSDEDIGEITEGSVFDLGEIGTSNLNVRAETGAGTESVIFGYQGTANFQTENLPVYAIGGNSGNDYKPWTPEVGANTLTATAYTEDRGAGTAGASLTVNFNITDGELDDEPDVELPAILRINSGGETVSFGDETFEADDFFAGNGKSFANNNITDILDTEKDALYKTERSTNGNPATFDYAFPVTDGEYEVRLHFVEIYWGATGGGSGGTGKRVFSVSIEGEEVLADFDLNAEEAPMTAVVRTFSAIVSDGELNLAFEGSVDQPKVAAIELFGEGSITNPPPADDCAWESLANSALAKVEAQSVKVNNKLYVLAGFLSGLKITPTTEIYDPETDNWSSGAPMPTAVTHMGAVAVGNEIWILAGFVGDHPGTATDEVQIYNTVTDSWSAGPSLPNPRGSGAAAYSDGKIHFFGGLLPDRRTDVGEHYVLDVNDVASGWEAAADMPDPRNHLSAAAVDGKIYAIGGQFGHDAGVQDQDFLDEYDPATDSWTRKADLPSARSHFEPGTIVHNGKIIIVGGRRGNFFFEDVTEYDPVTNSWSERCELPSKLLAPSAKVFGDRLIVANGGEGGTCCPKNSTISIGIEPETTSEPDAGLNVLVYHETNGFRHGSINAGIDMVEEFGGDLNWTVDASQSSAVFNADNLAGYDVVVWMNTSGNGLLTSAEQSAFEDFIRGGGGFVGVHAATDTYRDGSWPWYNDLVGGIVQVSPNHTPNNTNATMDVVGNHPATGHLGDTWNKSEEYYYWERNGGYLFEGNIDLLNVRTTGANSYDAPRPVTWYKNYDGGRSFYTALGHNSSDYEGNGNFRTMMEEAIIWAGGGGSLTATAAKAVLTKGNVPPVSDTGLIAYPNPATDRIYVASEKLLDTVGSEATLLGLDGNVVVQKTLKESDNQIELGNLPPGYYVLTLKNGSVEERQLVLVK